MTKGPAFLPMSEGDYKKSLQNVLSLFLGKAAAPANPKPAPDAEEALLVESLAKLFPAEDIVLIWREDDQDHGQGAIYLAEDDSARKLDPEEVRGYIGSTGDIEQNSAHSLVVRKDPLHPRVIGLSHRPDAPTGVGFSEKYSEQLWFFFPGPPDEESEAAFGWLSDYISGLKDLFMAFWALKRSSRYGTLLEESSEHQKAKSKLERLVADSSITTSQCLEEAAQLLNRIPVRSRTPELQLSNLELVIELTTWTMQEVLGDGWDLQVPLVSRRVAQASGGEHEALRKLISDVHQRTVGFPKDREGRDFARHVARLGDLNDILAAAIAIDVDHPDSDRKKMRPLAEWKASKTKLNRIRHVEPAEGLMVVWSRVHQISRGLSISSMPEEAGKRRLPEERWKDVINSSLPHLARYLERRYNDSAVRLRPHVSSWLRLWFCFNILSHIHDPDNGWDSRSILESEKWRFRADLAYVLRETLRALEFSDRRDFRFQPTNYARALLTLIEHHAQWVVKLPRELDVRALLREIGEPRRVDDYSFAAGHLQHALETYIAGHFFCNLKVEFPRDDEQPSERPWKVAEVLVGSDDLRPGPQAVSEFLQAFSLTALFHDIGILLFPRDLTPGDAFFREDRELKNNLHKVRDNLKNSAGTLLEHCQAELGEAEYFDVNEEPALSRWLDRAIQRGDPDHALLGAWYLHRVFQSVAEASSEVLRHTVRAVLLHSIFTQPILVERDPVAALLILCDELFEWAPYLEGNPRGAASSHSLQSIAVDLRPRIPRTVELKLDGFQVRTDGKGSLDCTLAPMNEGGTGWPCFEITLQEPRLLQQPVHFIWLTMAQNLGRVRQETGHRWSPTVRVRSQVPERLRAAGTDTHKLLSTAVKHNRMPIRPRLESWLSGKIFDFYPEFGIEQVTLKSSRKPLHTEPVYRSFRQLEIDIERIIRELEGRSYGLLDLLDG